jgi:hypothetical protein
MASAEIIPVLKKELVELTLGRNALRICVFVVGIPDEFNLGLDVLRACDASVDLRCHVLRLDCEEVPLLNPGTRSLRLTVASDEVILATCDRVMTE